MLLYFSNNYAKLYNELYGEMWPWPARGTAMEAGVRKELGVEGLLPPASSSLQLEADRAWAAISQCCTPLEKYQVPCSSSDARKVTCIHAQHINIWQLHLCPTWPGYKLARISLACS